MGISQITTCKGRAEDVMRHLPQWLDSGVDEVVLVDYDCPDLVAEQVLDCRANRDARVVVLDLPAEETGPFFNLALARNRGALVARHEYLFFLDADCVASPALIGDLRQAGAEIKIDLMVPRGPDTDPDAAFQPHPNLPAHWIVDGQCCIRNHAFWLLNGYNEDTCGRGWGGESYDLYARACDMSSQPGGQELMMGTFSRRHITHRAHGDEERERYNLLPLRELGLQGRGRALAFRVTSGEFSRVRSLNARAQPGRMFGRAAEWGPGIKVYRGGRTSAFRPGEDN